MKDTLMEIKDNLQGINSRVDQTENQINDMKHNETKNQWEQQEKRIQKNEASINSLQDNFKGSDIHFIENSERKLP